MLDLVDKPTNISRPKTIKQACMGPSQLAGQWGPGRCPGRGSGGLSPPEAEAFLSIDTQILMFYRTNTQ